MADSSFKQAFLKIMKDKYMIPDIAEKDLNYDKIYNTIVQFAERAEKDDEAYDKFDMHTIKTISEEGEQLAKWFSQLGYNPNLTCTGFLYKYFESLSLEKSKINALDPAIKQFANIRKLNLSINNIKSIQTLPPNIEELNLYKNQITDFGPCYSKSLYHLGVGYNMIADNQIGCICSNFPNLICLDISYNQLSDIKLMGDHFSNLSKLKSLFTKGNPLSTHPRYSQYYMSLMPSLMMFDGNKIIRKDEIPKVEIKNSKICFKLDAINLEGIQGIELQPENIKEGPNYDTLDETSKGSQYTIEANFLDTSVKSKPVLWKSQFVVDPITNVGKAKLSLSIKESLVPNQKLVESLYNGITIKLYENRPKLEKKSPTDPALAVIKNNLPEKEEILLAIAKIVFPEPLIHSFTRRYYFYSPELNKLPEYNAANKSIIEPLNLTEKQYLADKAKALCAPKQEAAATTTDKKVAKVDKKKEAKKKGKEETPVAQVEDITCDSEDNYMIMDKSFHKQFQRPVQKKKEEQKKDDKSKKPSAPKEHYMDTFFNVVPALQCSLIIKVDITEDT